MTKSRSSPGSPVGIYGMHVLSLMCAGNADIATSSETFADDLRKSRFFVVVYSSTTSPSYKSSVLTRHAGTGTLLCKVVRAVQASGEFQSPRGIKFNSTSVQGLSRVVLVLTLLFVFGIL